jgi:hypothetical protein
MFDAEFLFDFVLKTKQKKKKKKKKKKTINWNDVDVIKTFVTKLTNKQLSNLREVERT